VFPEEAEIRPITDKEFASFQALIYREAGIYLSAAKRPLLVGRLIRRLRELGLNSFTAYYRRVVEGDEAERIRLLDAISTNETHFFREPRQFDFLEERVFPEWSRQAASGSRARKIRAWSAACSTGEEPYSLAMLLLGHFPSSDWTIEILATDLSTRVLERARAAIWPMEKARKIPPWYLRNFMLRGTRSQEGKMKAGPEVRSVVRLERMNLNEKHYPVAGPFDLIFCRNVLIYFDQTTKAGVIDRLLNHLLPTGYLFLGHAESLNGLTNRVRCVFPTVYVKTERRGGQEDSNGE
jgi:chemotaxis protein methyltransferase CheR